jgi:hypothetical protein
MNKEEFEQLHATDQVSCNGVLGLVVGVDRDGVKIQFDGDRGAAILSTRDLGQLNSLRLERKAEPMHGAPNPRGLYPRGYYTRTDQS